MLMVSYRQNFSHIEGCLMSTEPETVRRDWRIPDELWERIQPLLPARKSHPLGCHRPRVDDRKAMDAIFFVLRTGCQWNALNETGICSPGSVSPDGRSQGRLVHTTRPALNRSI